MQRHTVMALLIGLLLPGVVLANLSGVWEGDDGGTYYLRHDGGKLYWYGEQQAAAPEWSNVFQGRVRYDYVLGEWLDVPKGKARGGGRLTLLVKKGGNVLEASYKTGGFGASRWERKGIQSTGAGAAKLTQNPPFAVDGGGTREADPRLTRADAKDNCISFSLRSVDLKKVEGRWKVIEKNRALFDFGRNWEDAWHAFRIIRFYRIDQSCSIGRDDHLLEYLLTEGVAPRGRLAGEKCQSIDTKALAVRDQEGLWQLTDGGAVGINFGSHKGEADRALTVVEKFKFNNLCRSEGKENSLSYFRR